MLLLIRYFYKYNNIAFGFHSSECSSFMKLNYNFLSIVPFIRIKAPDSEIFLLYLLYSTGLLFPVENYLSLLVLI